MSDVAHSSRTLIGRDAELRELCSLLGISPAGTGPAQRLHVLVSGDAGVGKTRLLQEFESRAADRGWDVYVGHCLDLGDSALPYMPFSELFDRLAERLPEVVEQVAVAYPALARLQPVRRLLGAVEGYSGEADRMQLFEGVHALLEAASARTPMVLVVEDLHWADQSTRDLLTFLFTRPLAGPVGIVGSYRADDLSRRHPLRRQVAEWSRLPGVARLGVAPLSSDEVRALVAELDPAATDRETADIVARAEGNAFFVEELVGAASGPDRWVPDDLAELLLMRLDRLDETARTVVRTASVAGHRVSHPLLAEVTDLSEEALDDALRQAVESHVLVAGEGTYTFRHALLGEAIYDDVLPGQRVRLHSRYAAALSAGVARGTAAELARHARLANDLDTALAASIRAGDEAATVGGPDEAAHHFERALQLLDDPQRTLPPGESAARVAEATVTALLSAGQTGRAARVAREQLERARTETPAERARLLTAEAVALGLLDNAAQGDPLAVSAEAIAASEGAEPALRARVLANHAQILRWCGRHEEAEQWGLDALALAERHDLPEIAAAAVTTLSSLARSDEPTAFRATVTSAIDRAMASGAVSAELQGRFVLASSYEEAAEWADAETSFRAAIELGERTGQPWAPYAFESRHQLAWVLYVTGRWDEAIRLVASAGAETPALVLAILDTTRLAIRQARGEPVPRRIHRSLWEVDAVVPIFSAATEIRAAETPAATLAVYEEVIASLTRAWGPGFGARIRLAATTLGRLADLAAGLSAGERAGLTELADRLLDEIASTWQRWDERRAWGPEGRAWSQRAEAEALRLRWLAGGQDLTGEELVAAWRETERLFEAFGHVHELALVRAALATVLRAAGDAAAARQVADLARAAARDLGARPLLQQLGSVPATAAGPAALTAREAEILGLVAQGRTNGEIGKQLFISTKTVSVHVSNILAKLGAASRTEAAAIAHSRGLVG